MDYCDVFISCLDSHSDGTHSLQSIHCWDTDAVTHFYKLIYILDGLRVSTCTVTIPLTSLTETVLSVELCLFFLALSWFAALLFCKQCSRIPACVIEPLDMVAVSAKDSHSTTVKRFIRTTSRVCVCVCVCEGRCMINIACSTAYLCLCIKTRCYFVLPVCDLVCCLSKLNLNL